MALAAAPTPAAAQSSLNLNAHCQEHHGPHARAIARNRSDAYSWVCDVGGRQFSINMQSACAEQYRPPARVVMRDRNDAHSWGCVR